MSTLTIKSRSHDYTVEFFDGLEDALRSIERRDAAYFLVDAVVAKMYRDVIAAYAPAERTVEIEASEPQKSFEALTPIFLRLLERGLKRSGKIVVIGGGVLQDIGCFIASVLFRGLTWELIPTTLLAQADSCIGSKSSVNIGPYKNQIGTFYPPHRVLQVSSVLQTLPADEIRSGMGEILKLQLLRGAADFDELISDLSATGPSPATVQKWVRRSMAVKQPYIESDEYDRGIRNLLNYGHTFGHAYESATKFAVPHGIAVSLGMLTATFVSVQLGLTSADHYSDLKRKLRPWYEPYNSVVRGAPPEAIFEAMKHDKKNTGAEITCILTRGPGRMEKTKVTFRETLVPILKNFFAQELD